MKFKLKSRFKPTGDQPEAIGKLTGGLKKGSYHQVLLGVTGSGKTFTMANIIANLNKPALIISHNKTLAAQMYREFKEFFPENAVSYFVSYYDYYQPEAYIVQTDTYIEKETDINEEIDRLRHETTANLLTRKDVIVVASVSAIYSLGSPIEYKKHILSLVKGQKIKREEILKRLVELQYERTNYEIKRGGFLAKGELVRIFPPYSDYCYKLEISEQGIGDILKEDYLSGEVIEKLDLVNLYPAKHYMTDPANYKDVFAQIKRDLAKQVKKLKDLGFAFEAYRLKKRVEYDIEMINQIGYVKGIENYSRYFDKRKTGEPPFTLLDYFPKKKSDWLLFIDESHMSIPQLRGMYAGDFSRKETLIKYGFRLPSCLDNRPLKFDELQAKVPATVFVSATPGDWEIKASGKVVEQLIRPTGITDPAVIIRKSSGQIKDLVNKIVERKRKNQRVLVTTLTKKMAEALSGYLNENSKEIAEKYNLSSPIVVDYLHSEINTLDRIDILDGLRSGDFDVLVGINLLREGLDLPEVSLVAILDADCEGFLRSETSLVQTMGRAARRVDSMVILYADNITGSIKRAIAEVNRRRNIQLAYNRQHNIVAQSITKPLGKKIVKEKQEEEKGEVYNLDSLTPFDKRQLIKKLKKLMNQAAKLLNFEKAARLRDLIKKAENNLS